MADMLQQAILAIKTGDVDRAGQLLAQILQNDSKNADAWVWLAHIARSEERRRACLDQALAINPDHPEVRQALLDWVLAVPPALIPTAAAGPPAPGIGPAHRTPSIPLSPTRSESDLKPAAGASLKEFLQQLTKNHNILREREAKYSSTAPLDLLNQIEDYERAIALTQEAIDRAAPLEELQDEFSSLNLQISTIVFMDQEPPRKPFKGLNPYRGLLKFTEDEAQFFFGRNAAIQSLLNIVQYLVEAKTGQKTPDLITVLGPSGSGKSSLVRAGLIPALRQGRVPGSQQWPIKVMLPGAHPLDTLAEAFIGQVGQDLGAIKQSLSRGPKGLHELIVESLTLGGRPEDAVFILVVDQFEETFTLCEDEAERRAFIDQILYATQNRQNRAFVILTVRSDLYSKLAGYKPLAEAVTKQQMLVSPMTEKELREAILLPAEAVGLELEKALVESLVKDTANAPGVLPLLQHALLELFHRRDGNLLTLDAYNEIGGVKGALAHRADSVINGLSQEQQDIAQRIFLRLVQPGEGTADTRRRATFDEVLTQTAGKEQVEAVVKILADANLIITDSQPNSDEIILDVSHEALIQEWPLLRYWLTKNRESVRIQQQVSHAVREWEARGQEKDSLYRGARLLEVEEWAKANPGILNPQEQAFIEASATARDREAVEKEAQQQRELEQAQKLAEEAQARQQVEAQRAQEAEEAVRRQAEAARRIRRYVIGLVVFVVIAIGFLFAAVFQQQRAKQEQERAEEQRQLAEQQKQAAEQAQQRAEEQQQVAEQQKQIAQQEQQRAEQQARRAQAGQLAAQARANLDTQFDLGLLLGVESYNLMKTIELTDTLEAQSSILAGAARNPSLRTFLQGHTDRVNALAFSSDGQVLASGGDDGTIILWDTKQARPQKQLLQAHDDWEINSLLFRPNSAEISGGQTLISGGGDGAIILWDLTTEPPGRTQLKAPDDNVSVTTLAISPDGELLISGGSNGAIILWDLSTNAVSKQLKDPDNVSVTSLAISPDGEILASSAGQTILLWDLTQEAPEGQPLPEGHTAQISSLAFNQTKPILASGSRDGTVILWDVPKKEQLGEPLFGHEDWVDQVAFTPFGDFLISVGEDNSVIVWDIESREGVIYSGHGTGAVSVAVDPEDPILASGSKDGTIILWDLIRPVPLGESVPSPDEVTWSQVAFRPNPAASTVSPSGSGDQILAIGRADGNIILWDTTTGQQAGQPLTGNEALINALAFSPDGQILASGDVENNIMIWDLTKDPPASQLLPDGHTDQINTLAFSPDGQILASSSQDQTVILWDMVKKQRLGEPLALHQDGVTSLAFSPSGQMLASGSSDSTVILWEVADPTQHQILYGHKNGVNGVAFNPQNDQMLASASEDTTIILWDLATDPPSQQTLKGHGDSVTRLTFSPDGQILASGDYDGKIFLWDMTNRRRLGDPLAGGHSDLINGLAFSPDGHILASVSTDNVILWDTDIESWQNLACHRANRNLSQGEWNQFIGSGVSYERTCPDLPLDPISYFAVVQAQAQAGNIAAARASFQEVREKYPNLADPALAWNSLCWYGGLWGQAADVMDACDQAVTLAADYDKADFRDSRGLARALAGNTAGAIEDFEAFVEAYHSDPELEADVNLREAWIADLKAGRNPFDEATLKALREE